jgi:uncharacterized protein YrrD
VKYTTSLKWSSLLFTIPIKCQSFIMFRILLNHNNHNNNHKLLLINHINKISQKRVISTTTTTNNNNNNNIGTSSSTPSFSSSSYSDDSHAFSRQFHRVFSAGLSIITLLAFDSAVDDVLLFQKAKTFALPRLENSKRVMNVVSNNNNNTSNNNSNNNNNNNTIKSKDEIEIDSWYNSSCNRRGKDYRVIAFIADGERASCDVKVVLMRKYEHRHRDDTNTNNKNSSKDDDKPKAKAYESAWLRSPLKYLPESIKNALAMDSIWEIVEVSATLPNERGMGVPGQVDLLGSEKENDYMMNKIKTKK